jgi:hypothetical protein
MIIYLMAFNIYLHLLDGGMVHSPSQNSLTSISSNVSLSRKKSAKEKKDKDKNKKGKGRARLSKNDIGTPENFQ